MDCRDWNRLMKNRVGLGDVHPDCVKPYLYQYGILHMEAKEKKFKSIDDVLKILRDCPKVDTFSCFMAALRNTGHEELANQIESTEGSGDPGVKVRGDPTLLEPRVREILLNKFEERKDTEMSFEDVREELIREGAFKEITWDDRRLKEFILLLYSGVEIPPNSRRRRGGKKVRVGIVKNLCRIAGATADEYSSAAIKELQSTDFAQASSVKEMSCPALKEFLISQFQAEDLPVEDLDAFQEHKISGKTFLKLDKKDIDELLPDAKLGARRFLVMLVEQLSEPLVVSHSTQNLRDFDAPVSSLIFYSKGLCCDTSSCARDRTTRAVKLFHLIDESSKHQVPEFIASEIVPFASACLNERRNGTIYFGISNSHMSPYKPGEVVGIPLSQREASVAIEKESKGKVKQKTTPCTQKSIQDEINYYLLNSFRTRFQGIIKHAVRDAKFVPVLVKDESDSLWVIEVDIKPSSELLKEEIISTQLKLFPAHGRKSKLEEGIFRLSSDGKPALLASEARDIFEREHSCILTQRKQDELDASPHEKPNLRKKFLNLLTGGNDVIEDMMFFFLMLSPVTESSLKENLSAENLQFIEYLCPEIVFDFDPRNGIHSSLKSTVITRVLTTDNFDESKHTPEQMKELKDSLFNENKISWFFCNGYAPLTPETSAVEWNKLRKSSFQECLRWFITTYGKERVTVIICLMAQDYDIMTSASGEVLSVLSDNWMVLAESENIAQNWQKQVLLRNWVNQEDLDDRCVIGMPWNHVNLTIKQAKRQIPSNVCHIPTSTGTLIEVREKKVKDWCHIDILSAKFQPPDDDQYARQVEEHFYRGEQAHWSNFYFKTQVLIRDKHNKLLSLVENALKNCERSKRNKVGTVELIHQPMAGGTTSAKQVLWDLRDQYRCCIVKAITEHTTRQLNELHKYDETSPKPLLILIDNEDDDKLLQLLEELEDQGQKMKSGDSDDIHEVYCVALICTRKISITQSDRRKHVCLEHELSRNELQWFAEKDKYLNERFANNEASYTNPKFLLAFNIIKKKFDRKYIEKTLSVFTDEVVTDREVKLLKIVSFLNFYDPHFTKITVSSLDDLLLDKKKIWGTRDQMLIRNPKWEACLSPAVKVLLNVSSESLRTDKNRSTVCTFNKVIAEGILKRIMERTGQKVSEIMLELLDSSMFVQQKFDTMNLINIVNNIVKTRALVEGTKQKFSQFLTDVNCAEGPEKAFNVLKQVFEMNDDPFTAQLIARFCMIQLKNWDDAEIYARRATLKLPTNSYLWDTYAYVYQSQLQDEIKNTSTIVSQKKIKNWISLSRKSLDMFRKEKEVTDKSEEHEVNLACYFGELRAIEAILQGISKGVGFSSISLFHKFLVDPEFLPPELDFLTDEETKHFKGLKELSEEAFTRLHDECVQMKSTCNFGSKSHVSDYDFSSLAKLSVSLESCFGQDVLFSNMVEKESYNYSLAKKLGGTHMNELLKLRDKKSLKKLQEIYELMKENLKFESEHKFKYLLTAVGCSTLLMLENKSPSDLQFNTVLSWCRSLIGLNKERPRGRMYLEPYLYFVMYNFPTKERNEFQICSSNELSKIIRAGTVAFQKNNPNYAGSRIRRRKFTTLFFLGKEGPLHDILHQDMLSKGMDGQSVEDKWQSPEVVKTLRQMEGNLLEGGSLIRFFHCEIQTAYRVTDTAMWQKQVKFFVGFSWAGPLAYGITLID